MLHHATPPPGARSLALSWNMSVPVLTPLSLASFYKFLFDSIKIQAHYVGKFVAHERARDRCLLLKIKLPWAVQLLSMQCFVLEW